MGMNPGTKLLLASISPLAAAAGWATLDPEPESAEERAERIEAHRVARAGHDAVMAKRCMELPQVKAAEDKRARKNARRLALRSPR